MAKYFIGDPHFFHQSMTKWRPFETVEEHNETLLNNWNSTVTASDEVFVVGDVVFGGLKENIYYLNALNGKKILIVGNHDRCFAANKNHYNHVSRYLEVFDVVLQHARVTYEGVEFLVNHFPYDGDHTKKDRYSQYRMIDNGVPLIHAHTHSTEFFSRSENGTPQMCVSAEAIRFTPISLGDITKRFKEYLKISR